jgi:hypothetical protein
MKKNTSSTSVKAARAELAAKRRRREVQFARTVLGWQNDEMIGVETAFPATVMGWDHPAAQVGTSASRSASPRRTARHHRARGVIWIGIALIAACAGILVALLR